MQLPSRIKSLSNDIKLFRPALKRVLLSNSFYSINEYFHSSSSSISTATLVGFGLLNYR